VLGYETFEQPSFFSQMHAWQFSSSVTSVYSVYFTDATMLFMLIENQTQLMVSMLYQLSLCVITVIQLTSSQSTWDNDVSTCADSKQAQNQLITMNSQLMKAVSHLTNVVSQLTEAVAQLQKDVEDLKTGSGEKDVACK